MTDQILAHDSANIRRAVMLSFFENAAFSAQNALMQQAGKSIDVPLIIAANSTVMLLIVVLASLARGHRLYFKTAYPRQQTVRCLLRVVANALGLWALLHLPLTTHVVLGFMSPLIIAVLSPLLLNEPRVNKAVVSVALGLAGMFIILSVDSAPLVPMLVSFASVVIGSLNGIFVRRMPRDHPFTFMLYTNLFLTFTFWPFAISDLPKLTSDVLPVMLGVSFFAALSNYMYFRCNLLASPQHTAPLKYTQLLWAVAFSWLATRHVPDNTFWLGAALIIVGSALLLPRAKPNT